MLIEPSDRITEYKNCITNSSSSDKILEQFE